MKIVIFSQTFGYFKPLGVGYIKSYLDKYLDFKVEIKTVASESTRLQTNNVRLEKDFNEIKEAGPDIVGFTAYTMNYEYIKKLAGKVKKELKTPAFIGGPHIIGLPSNLDKSIDVAVVGEGEQTILELIKTFRLRKKFAPKDLKKINGIMFHNQGKVEITKPREFITPLDKIPMPSREAIDDGKTDAETVPIMTARGCPYTCVFCTSQKLWNKFREFSAKYVIKEIKQLCKRYKSLKTIDIVDDLFIVDKKRLEKIANEMEKSGINKRIGFHARARANLLDEKTVILLKKMNVIDLQIGFESGSQRVLKWLKGESASVEANHKAWKLCKKYGIIIRGSFVIGNPGETREEMMETYNFIEEHPMEFCNLHVAVPLPGTQYWKIAKQKGIVSDSMNFDELFDFEISEFLPNFDKYKGTLLIDKVSSEEFYKIYQKFMELFVKTSGKENKSWKVALFKTGIVYKFPKLWQFLKKTRDRLRK